MTKSGVQDAVATAADFIKVTGSLAIGALVFGVGLIPNATTLLPWERVVLTIAELAFVISVVTGFLAFSRIPMMQQAGTLNLQDSKFEAQGRAHQICFVTGVILLATVLARNLYSEPPVDSLALETPIDAVRAAERNIKPPFYVTSISTVEFIKGVDAARPALGAWHVKLSVKHTGKNQKETLTDLYFDPATGKSQPGNTQ